MALYNWMTDLYAGFINNRPLREITLPGSHDSGCSLKDLTFSHMARTQVFDIENQLLRGIRYFDIRPYPGLKDWYTWHGPFYTGESISSIVVGLKRFMQRVECDKELVILNISHFTDRFPLTFKHQQFIDYLSAELGAWLAPYTQAQINLFNTPYRDILRAPTGSPRSRIAILYDGAYDQNLIPFLNNNNFPIALPPGFFIPNKYKSQPNPIFLYDIYSQQPTVPEMAAIQHARLINRNPTIHQAANTPGRLITSYADATRQAILAAMAAPPATAPIGDTVANAIGGVAGILHLYSWTCTYSYQSAYYSICARATSTVNPQLLAHFMDGGLWGGGHNGYHPEHHPKINILYTDHFSSDHVIGLQTGRDNDAEFFNYPVPVAISAKLNKYGGTNEYAWSGWANWAQEHSGD